MELNELEKLFSDEIEITFKNVKFRLKQPPLNKSINLITKWAESSKDKGSSSREDRSELVEAMVLALQNTLVSDKPVTKELAERIIIRTGLIISPIGNAALELCGLQVLNEGAVEVPKEKDIPT